MKSISYHNNIYIYGFITIFITILLFLISPDSYTHDLFNRADSSVFFMCGKAWMNGMIPYVDYTDSKGPLLWLIYGIGYLFSHYDYIGVFWLSCIMYTGVFILIFKTANLFLKDSCLSLLCVLLMSLSIFNPWYHYEIRAEDWCQIFIILAIYRISLHLYTDFTVSDYLTSYLLGICFAGPLFIKYSISIMMGTIMLYALYYFIRSKKNVIIPIFLFILGVCTIILPFVIYFYFIGNLDDFINEYFLNTFKTIQGSNSIGTYIHEFLNIFANPAEAILFIISVTGSILFGKSVKNYNYFPLFTIIGFWLITIHHGAEYYYSICTLFPIWFVISLLHNTSFYSHTISTKKLNYYSIIIISFCTLWNYTFTDGFLLRNLFFYDNDYRTDYYKVSQLMSQVQNPTIIYMHSTVSHGEGTPIGVLPGSKYFFSQLGVTQEMERIQREDVRRGKADFIVIASHQISDSDKELLSEGNYQKCYEYRYWSYCYYVYTKHTITPPTNDIHMSNLDVLLKNNYIK